MICAEFQEQVDAWVLGALDAAEGDACAAHLASVGRHDGCLEALARAREAAAALAATLPTEQPHPRLWEAIERAVGEPSRPARVRPARRERVAWALAVAAMVAVGLFGWMLRDERRRVGALADAAARSHAADQTALTAAQGRAAQAGTDRLVCLHEIADLKSSSLLQREALALLEDPSTRVVAFTAPGGGGYKASAIFNAATHRAIVVSSALATKPGSDFELWIIRGTGAPQPAGFLRQGPGGVAAGEIDRTLLAQGAPDAFAVSIEPAGGRPTPTQVILVGAMKS